MKTVNEKTTCAISLAFFDEDGTAVTPSAGTYRIDDELTGTAIKASTPFTPSGTTHTLTITSAENAVLNKENALEVHVVTISITYGTSKTCYEEVKYAVKNLKFVT